METEKMRKGFSMLLAIVTIVVMAAIGGFVMSLSGKIVKATTTQYQEQQAQLYAKSYTEYAILAVTGNDRSVNCLQDITANIGSPDSGNGYQVRTHIAYIVNGDAVDTSRCDGVRILSDQVDTNSTPLTIIIDAYVDYKDPDNTNGPWLTVHRRSVQKI